MLSFLGKGSNSVSLSPSSLYFVIVVVGCFLVKREYKWRGLSHREASSVNFFTFRDIGPSTADFSALLCSKLIKQDRLRECKSAMIYRIKSKLFIL